MKWRNDEFQSVCRYSKYGQEVNSSQNSGDHGLDVSWSKYPPTNGECNEVREGNTKSGQNVSQCKVPNILHGHFIKLYGIVSERGMEDEAVARDPKETNDKIINSQRYRCCGW